MDKISLKERVKYAWNAFVNKDPTEYIYENRWMGGSYSYRYDKSRFSRGNEKTIVSSVYNRIALDVASINIRHVQTDDNGRYLSDIHSSLNNCLTRKANIDQSSRNFFQDVVMSLLDEGCVAIVPTDIFLYDNVFVNGFDVLKMRTGRILNWYPKHVEVRVYNELTGVKEDKILSKEMVAIIENPLYAVINEPNSTLKRLIHKLAMLDEVDKQSSSGKLDLIMQLPYSIKSESREAQAAKRRDELVNQLKDSVYGVGYIDGTEKVTQLNRPIENNLMKQVEYLTALLWSQLGMTQEILDGRADEGTMTNYYNRTTEPILSAITDAINLTFLSKKQVANNEEIKYFRDPFKLVPANSLAEIADKLTRNEIMSSNEFRQVLGMKPVDDPRADELRNKNLNAEADYDPMSTEEEKGYYND